jgi:cell division septal protein FtsQ
MITAKTKKITARTRSFREGVNAKHAREMRRRKRREKLQEILKLSVRTGGRVSALLLFFAVVAFGGAAAYKLIQKQGWFVLRKIEISGINQLSSEVIYDALQIELGIPTAELDVGVLKERLEEEIWVREALVDVEWPGTLEIKISESTPVGIWYDGNRWYHVSEKGDLLPGEVFAMGEHPVITCSSEEKLKDLAPLLHWIEKKDQQLFGNLSQLHQDEYSQDIEVYLRNSPLKILLNSERFELRVLRDLRLLWNNYGEAVAKSGILDFRYPGFAYIR